MNEGIYYIVYTSEASKTMDHNKISEILRISREKNSKKGITGMLLYIKNDFIQLLEGDKEEILSLYEVISKDPRHGNVKTLISCHGDKRLFSEWSMGFSSFDNLEKLNEFAFAKNVDTKGLFDQDLSNVFHPALLLLKCFHASRSI